jgi:membrane protein DedA with SNARE-associated domain
VVYRHGHPRQSPRSLGFNYWIAVRFGRPFIERFGKYVLVSPETLDKADRFFARHGHISTFVGRLIPGIASTSPFRRESPG